MTIVPVDSPGPGGRLRVLVAVPVWAAVRVVKGPVKSASETAGSKTIAVPVESPGPGGRLTVVGAVPV